MEKSNLDDARELPQTNTGEKRKREGDTRNSSETGDVVFFGDAKAFKEFCVDGGEQSLRSVFSKGHGFDVESDRTRKGSLPKVETVEESERAKQYANFNDFDKLREESGFAVGQTWALYDTDGMPRLYAQISEVSVPGFGVSVTWLEPDPDEEEMKRRENELPFSTGKFRLGENKSIEDRRRFSHMVHCNEGSSPGKFSIYPRKGETWAVFKGRFITVTEIDWSTDPDSLSKYQYVFVEILSDEVVGYGLCVPVGFLHKAKGFSSVFCRFTKETKRSLFSRDGNYQFSHRVPSFKTTGFEAKGVPRGAYELDPIALPDHIKDIDVPSHLVREPAMSNSESNTHSDRVYFAYKGKTFEAGQIWSFYSGDDSLPRHYGKIQKIAFLQAFEQDPVVEVHVARLRAKPLEGVIQWIDKKMPISCGSFRANKALEIFTDLDVFSRLISLESFGDGNDYSIFPKAGDFWVIHRYWSSEDDFCDLQHQSYDLVEVLDDKSDYTVLRLTPDCRFTYAKTTGFRMVYAAATEKWVAWADLPVRFTIPKSEMLRFSYQVPTSRVTEEIDGVLEAVYEPDVELLPDNVCISFS